MGDGKQKLPKKSIRELDEFKKFKKALEEGFVVKENGIEVTNPMLLDLSQGIARVLSRSGGSRQQRADTVNQFRKFFNEIRGLKELINQPSKLGVELRMLRARMGYAAGRQTITEDFSIVINDCIDAMLRLGEVHIQIQGFCDLFESLYAYYYYHAKVR